mmetsp:Transcript_21626/g.62048  ORF Transcript_21626/g.62048 Transcript_21626/m.62048 type:complete len:310 (+) Transcript_21626:218-1147(+)
MSNKPRIATRLKEAIGAANPNYSSPDLKTLEARFSILKGQLANLVAALSDHYESMVRMNKTRAQVAKAIGDISAESPIYVYAGAPAGSSAAAAASAADGSDETTVSYASVHNVLASRHEMYTERYLKFVVEYAAEWEKVVVTKITASLKKAEHLRVDLDHYQSKVDNMQHSMRNAVDRGKAVDPNQQERMRRNTEKLQKARNEYESFVSALCVLLEEVTDSCWKDLQPLLTKIIQFEYTLNADEARFLQNINHALDALEDVARKHGLDVNAPEGPGISKCRTFDEPDADGREASNGDLNASTMSVDDEV